MTTEFNAKSKELFHFAFAKSDPDFYAPAEDTFLFLDVLESEFSRPEFAKDGLLLEIGPGSGVLSGYFTRKAKESGKFFHTVAVDLNPAALAATVETFRGVKVLSRVDPVLGDGTSGMFRGLFDVILCNPPYVPAARDEISGLLVHAYAGGLPDGREVIDGVIATASALLGVDGNFFLLLDERNRPEDVVAFAASHGLRGSLVLRRKVPGELLSVWRFTRNLVS
jgi:release factor glutamine methyltransferase